MDEMSILQTEDGKEFKVVDAEARTAEALTVTAQNGNGFTVVVGNDKSMVFPVTKQVFVTVRLDVSVTAEVAAGAYITIGKLANYFPGVMTAAAVYVGTNNARRYMASVDLAGNIMIRPNTAMTAGTYGIYLSAAYVAV